MADERLEDPFPTYRYVMTIDGLDETIQFKEVSGLESSTEVIEYQEGGETQQPLKKLPGRTKYTNLTIKRGITSDLGLWEWYSEVVDKDRDGLERRNAIITMRDGDEGEEKVYTLSEVWPCRYKGPDLDAQGDDVAFEEIEFVCEALEIE